MSMHEWVVVVFVLALMTTTTLLTYWYREPDYDAVVERTLFSHGGMITVIVSGAVEKPGPIEVREGTKMSDLAGLVRLEPNADSSVFLKQHKLKEGEEIVVPLTYDSGN